MNWALTLILFDSLLSSSRCIKVSQWPADPPAEIHAFRSQPQHNMEMSSFWGKIFSHWCRITGETIEPSIGCFTPKASSNGPICLWVIQFAMPKARCELDSSLECFAHELTAEEALREADILKRFYFSNFPLVTGRCYRNRRNGDCAYFKGFSLILILTLFIVLHSSSICITWIRQSVI